MIVLLRFQQIMHKVIAVAGLIHDAAELRKKEIEDKKESVDSFQRDTFLLIILPKESIKIDR